jgi:hypothetical protein
VLQAVAVCALRTVRLSQASRCLALGATLRHQLLTLGSSLLMRCALDVCTALLDGPTGDESTEAGALQLDAGRVRSLVGAQLVLCPAGEVDDGVLSHRVRLRAEVLQDVVAHVRATDVPLLDAVAHVRATLRCTLAFLVAHGECSSSSGAGGPGAGGPGAGGPDVLLGPGPALPRVLHCLIALHVAGYDARAASELLEDDDALANLVDLVRSVQTSGEMCVS